MYLPLLLVLMRLSLGTVNAATSITFPQTTSMRPGDVILVKGFLRNRKMPFRLRIDTFRNEVILLDLRGMRHQIFIRPDYLQKRNSIRPGRKFLLKLRLTTNSLLIYLDTAIEKEIPFQDSIRKVAMQYSYRSGEVLKVDRDTYTCRSGIQSCGSPELFIDSPKQLCPATQVRKKIVGGQPSSPGANPWQVSIRKKNPYPGEAPHVCGGVLIDSCWVLSATHCFPMDTARATYLVRVGDYYNRDDMAKAFRNLENSKDFNIEKIFKAPNYNTSPSTRNDLTLIRLEDDNNDNICAEYGPFVKPVCLPTAADTYPIGNRECVITGWGATEQGQALENYPPCLQNAGVNLISKSECELSYPRNGKHQRILDTMVCAEARGKDSCQGDSGGPLVCSSSNEGPYTIWGITSWGEGCASKPGVYTKIFSFTNWIEEAMGDYCNYDPW